uniref:HMG box domain-containing protein n=1 Tax=Macrostomum lignano TaxID=282301 RepID=A0A1I8J7S5_9PLAT
MGRHGKVRKRSTWSMFVKLRGSNGFSKDRMAFLANEFKQLTSEDKAVLENAAKEAKQQCLSRCPSSLELEEMARGLYADYHILLIVKKRNGSSFRTCASPEVAGLLNENSGLLQKFDLLSAGLAEPSTRKPTVEHMRKEVRASVRMAYAQAGMGAKLNFKNLRGAFFPSIKNPAEMNAAELREAYESRGHLRFIRIESENRPPAASAASRPHTLSSDPNPASDLWPVGAAAQAFRLSSDSAGGSAVIVGRGSAGGSAVVVGRGSAGGSAV